MAVGNKQHANQSWDYVFDVDIADGAPVKKLAANKGEDPYDVTDRFLQQEQLPLSYRQVEVNDQACCIMT
jgi:phospholipase A-2-activating protein